MQSPSYSLSVFFVSAKEKEEISFSPHALCLLAFALSPKMKQYAYEKIFHLIQATRIILYSINLVDVHNLFKL